jgi:predicted homoserine dehydrogenase-like protein
VYIGQGYSGSHSSSVQWPAFGRETGFCCSEALSARKQAGMSTKRISIGMLGAGGYGRSARANLRHAGEFNIAVCMDKNQEVAETAASEEGSEAVTTIEELLAFPGLDAVSINTPIPHHAEHSLRCLEAGKHVLITKPVARSVVEARAVAEEASRSQLAYMVGHHGRPCIVHSEDKAGNRVRRPRTHLQHPVHKLFQLRPESEARRLAGGAGRESRRPPVALRHPPSRPSARPFW